MITLYQFLLTETRGIECGFYIDSNWSWTCSRLDLPNEFSHCFVQWHFDLSTAVNSGYLDGEDNRVKPTYRQLCMCGYDNMTSFTNVDLSNKCTMRLPNKQFNSLLKQSSGQHKFSSKHSFTFFSNQLRRKIFIVLNFWAQIQWRKRLFNRLAINWTSYGQQRQFVLQLQATNLRASVLQGVTASLEPQC